MRKYKVERIQDSYRPFVTLDKKLREEHGLSIGELVTLKFGHNLATAEVLPQLRELIGTSSVLLSSSIATRLDCIEGEEIEIAGRAREEEQKRLEHIQVMDSLPADFLKQIMMMKARKGLK